jgi:antitoxin component of RelBE/YafQ-DinJ toxin-antitoxin module
LPFELNTPNREAIKAMKELKDGKGVKFNSKEELLKDLGL